jgi:HlyD family secretion protein
MTPPTSHDVTAHDPSTTPVAPAASDPTLGRMTPATRASRRRWALGTAAVVLGAAALAVTQADRAQAADDKAAPAAPKPALTVTAVTPQESTLPVTLAANGSLYAWQEASVGAEVNGLRLAEVRVNVGDPVRRGQVLAVFAAETVQAELAQARASLVEAEANAAEAQANAERARSLQASGALSAQQITQLLTGEQTARARVEAARATARAAEVRLAQTTLRAPDDGIISARTATVGAVIGAGTELFRLIRQGRLEWRAEVPAADLAGVKPGQPVRLRAAGMTPADAPLAGRVRIVAPTVDPATRNGLVYVDLVGPRGPAKAGMFARGELDIGSGRGLTLPQSAVLLRDGFHVVLRIGADSKVQPVKVGVGVRQGDRLQITGGLEPGARVVATGGAFLAEGDTVRVVDAAPQRAAVPARPTPATAR